jgi:hypothetical protein
MRYWPFMLAPVLIGFVLEVWWLHAHPCLERRPVETICPQPIFIDNTQIWLYHPCTVEECVRRRE